MKKFLALLLLVCLLPLCALAEMDEDGNVVVALDGAEVSFTSLEGVYLLTRDSSASEFNRLGLSQREIVPSMEKEDLYALFFDMELEVEIQICIKPTADSNYDDLNAEQLAQACEDISTAHESLGWRVETAEPYLAPGGHQYVKSAYSYTFEDGSTTCSAEYYTRQAGYALGILIYPFGNEVTAAQLAQGAAIADSLHIKPLGDYTELTVDGVRVRFSLPEGLKFRTAADDAEDWADLPKATATAHRKSLAMGWINGLIVAPDGTWEISWTVFKGADNGTLDYVSDEEAQAFCETQMDSYVGAGHTVGSGSAKWLGAHCYVNIVYSYTDEGSGKIVYVVEYYTRQDGWNVLMALTSDGKPVPQEAKTLAEEIAASQRITVVE